MTVCLQDFFIQTMDIEEGDSGKFGFDPLDCTKVSLYSVLLELLTLLSYLKGKVL